MKKPKLEKVAARTAFRFNWYQILQAAVEQGVAYSVRSRLFKYTDPPEDWSASHEDKAIEVITNSVMSALSDVIVNESEA